MTEGGSLKPIVDLSLELGISSDSLITRLLSIGKRGSTLQRKRRHSATNRSSLFLNCVSTGPQHWPSKGKTATAGRWRGYIAKVSTRMLNKCAEAWPGYIVDTHRRIRRYTLSRMRRKQRSVDCGLMLNQCRRGCGGISRSQ
jgi:hypothetical protein